MATIQNERLKVTFRFDPNRLFSSRFESIGVMTQVCLDGRYHFCEPEQRIESRVTCYGTGLCGEYAWDELAAEAAPGQQFPKLGVGLLTQRAEGGPYFIFNEYEVEPFPTFAQFGPDRAVFVQIGKPCLGVCANITKTVTLHGNEIHVQTTVENVGQRTLDLGEYQHNFVSLNGTPVGPGYLLRVPFDGTLPRISQAAFALDDFSHRVDGYMAVEGDTVRWLRAMDGHGYHKETQGADLHPERGSFWRLCHETLPLAVEERISFTPQKLVIWGVEHCVCTEVYVPIHVLPGQCQTWQRVWRFEAGKTEDDG